MDTDHIEPLDLIVPADDQADAGDSMSIAESLWFPGPGLEVSDPWWPRVSTHADASLTETGSMEPTPRKMSKKARFRASEKSIRNLLSDWAQDQGTYPSTEAKNEIALWLDITRARVTNFCNNNRKRFWKVDGKHMSFVMCVKESQKQKGEIKRPD
jgi:hypothetical protein